MRIHILGQIPSLILSTRITASAKSTFGRQITVIARSNIQLLTDAIITAAHASKSNEIPAPHVIHTGIVALRIFEHALRQYFCEYKNGLISEYPKVSKLFYSFYF